MAFSEGFYKAAAGMPTFARTLGKTLSAPPKAALLGTVRAAKAVGRQTKEFGKGLAEGVPPARKSPFTGAKKPERGATLAAKQVEKKQKAGELTTTPQTAREHAQKGALSKIKERADRRKHGPSFIQKHPLLSAGGAYVGYKALTSPSGESREPQVVYPQAQY